MSGFPSSLVGQLQGAARLQHLLSQALVDRQFTQSGGELAYVIDTNVMLFYAAPEEEPDRAWRFMRVLESKERDRADVGTPALLSTVGRASLDRFFSEANHQAILFPSFYKAELASNIEKIFRQMQARALHHVLDAVRLDEKISNIIDSVDSGCLADVWPKLKELPHFIISKFFPDELPLQRLQRAMSLAVRGNATYNKYIVPVDGDPRRQWLFDQIFALRGESPEHIWNDVDAILSVVYLNFKLELQGKRFLFLTGDRNIHVVIDKIYLMGDGGGFDWPEFNFVRRPVQLTNFLHPKDEEGHRATLESLRLLLGIGRAKQLDQAVFNAMHGRADEAFPWALSHISQSHAAMRIVMAVVGQIEDSVRKSREADLLFQTARRLSEMEIKKGGVISKLREFLGRQEAFVVSEIDSYKDTLRKFSVYMRPEFVLDQEKMVDAFKDMLGIAVGSGQAQTRMWHRLPFFPRMPEHARNEFEKFFRGATQESDEEAIANLGKMSLESVLLFNAFLSALMGDWDAVVAQCDQVLDFPEGATKDTEQLAEFRYVRAVACRHVIRPSVAFFSKGLSDLEQARQACGNPRYLGELAAYGLSIPYHRKYYPGDYPEAIEHQPSPEESWALLLEAEQVASGHPEFKENTELSLRFLTQLCCNKINCFLYSRYIGRDFFVLPDEFWSDLRKQEVMNALDTLRRVVVLRGGLERVSYIVRFVLAAGECALARDSGQEEAVSVALRTLRAILAEADALGHKMLGYDRDKFSEMLRVFDGPGLDAE